MKQAITLRPSPTQLPERVREAIAEQEDRTERLIGWLQLGVVLTFGTLYLVSPKTYPVNPPFRPVPWVLSLYLLLTVLRILWTRKWRLPDWAVGGSIVVDVSLLMVLIWSFHIQYGQPPSFYLKAPTLLYVFIFIALRALRFDARFVILTGVVAALGWGAMILYVVLSDPSNAMITGDYITYMTSNAILLGAEFDKIISILVVSLILGVALLRGRALLVRSVKESIAAGELSRFFAPEIADRIRTSERSIAPGSAEIVEAAVLNLDLRGFTRLAQDLPPREVLAILGAYQALVVPIVERHGGSIDKFLGDGVLASFGAVTENPRYAAAALEAMEEIMAAGEVWRAETQAEGHPCPEINAAVATGPVLFGAVGADNRLEITVIGEAVNLAAKLEKHNKRLGSRGLATAACYRLALEQGYTPVSIPGELTAQRAEGVGQPLDLVRIA